MDICIIGLGSIGQRHLRNIHAVAAQRGVDVATDVVEPRELNYLDAVTRALVRNRFAAPDVLGRYDMIFVTNPSQLHAETLAAVRDRADFFFVEKPVFTQALDGDALAPYADERKFYVACPIRHTRVYGFLSEFVPQNKVYCARAICSSYLPEWRLPPHVRRAGGFGRGQARPHPRVRLPLHLVRAAAGRASSRGQVLRARAEERGRRVVRGAVSRQDAGTASRLLRARAAPRDRALHGRRRRRVRFHQGRDQVPQERETDRPRRGAQRFDFALGGAANINSIPYANSIIGFVQGE